MKRSVLVLSFLTASWGEASIVREFYRSSEMMGMGNAGIAVVDGENAIFYNPAGLASDQGMTLHIPKVDIAISSDVVNAQDSLSSLSSPTGSALSPFMGMNIGLQATGTAALVIPHVGFAGFYDVQGALSPVNQSIPKVEFGYQKTSGFQFGMGFSTRGTGTRRRDGRGKKASLIPQEEWRGGFTGKYIQRTGGFRVFPIADILLYNDPKDLLDQLGGTGSGYGADVGLQRVQPLDSRWTLFWGMAWTNIGDISVGNGSDPVKSVLATGVAARHKSPLGDFTLAYDIRHLTREDDWRKKQHLGMSFEFPFLLTLYGGLNQTFVTYGAGVDLFFLKINALSYGLETGSYVGQDPERRYQLTLEARLPL